MTRDQLALKFTGTGVELGVAAGRYSRSILRNKAVERLYSIDRWADHHSSLEYKDVVERFAGFKNSCVLRMSFDEALSFFGDNSLDFVYLDGYAHDGDGVLHNLRQWYNKVKPGGIFAGHDYAPRWPKAVAAIDQFMKESNLGFDLTEGDDFASWYLMKEHSSVRSFSENKKDSSVVLVGNGPSVLLKAQGPIIDSFQEVVRFNTFKIKGYEDFVGTKTTLWSTFGRGQLPRDEDQRPDKILFIHGNTGMPAYTPNELLRLSLDFYTSVKLRLHSIIGAEKPWIIPSSGLVVALWFLEHLNYERIHLIGFDHFRKHQSRLHHYWINRSYGKPKEHDGEAEAKLLEEYVKQNRIIYL